MEGQILKKIRRFHSLNQNFELGERTTRAIERVLLHFWFLYNKDIVFHNKYANDSWNLSPMIAWHAIETV